MKREDCPHCSGINPAPCPEHDAPILAAATLWKFIQQQRTDGRHLRTFRRACLWGIFKGDVLVNWGYGPNAKTWAARQAANCWDGELRAQHMGIH